MHLLAIAQVHGRVLGGKTLSDMHTFKGSHKEAERERFLNMVGILPPAVQSRFKNAIRCPTSELCDAGAAAAW